MNFSFISVYSEQKYLHVVLSGRCGMCWKSRSTILL